MRGFVHHYVLLLRWPSYDMKRGGVADRMKGVLRDTQAGVAEQDATIAFSLLKLFHSYAAAQAIRTTDKNFLFLFILLVYIGSLVGSLGAGVDSQQPVAVVSSWGESQGNTPGGTDAQLVHSTDLRETSEGTRLLLEGQ